MTNIDPLALKYAFAPFIAFVVIISIFIFMKTRG